MIFVDTSFLYPLFSAKDRDHSRVREVFEEFRITDALAVDSDFTHRFTARPGPGR